MHFYGIGFYETKKLPLKAFWMLQRNIDRLEASSDYRQLQLICSATSSEGVKDVSERLLKTIGKVVIYDEQKRVEHIQEEQLDRAGLNRIRGKGRLR